MVELAKESKSAVGVRHSAGFQHIAATLGENIIGQKNLIDALLVALLSNGHVLIEGMPGLAKTRAAKALASSVDADFHRVQFTPDLLPSDVVGTDIYLQEQHRFEFRKGPIFNHFVLADEINRAPAKVQSALLEAMEERQVTVGNKTYPLPAPFMVLATQNPIEQEGTYPLPEAQLDRFLLHVVVDYPSYEEEVAIMGLHDKTLADKKKLPTLATVNDVLEAQKQAETVYMDPKLTAYIATLTLATRKPKRYDEKLTKWIRFGASPRASIGLAKASKARAWLEGKDYVSPSHIQSLLPMVLRHRLILSYEAEAEGITTDKIVETLLSLVAVP